jgi:hypothetical protein
MAALPFKHAPDFRAQPRCRHEIDCAGAQLHVHARSSATVLCLEGGIDASNADLLGRAIRRYSRLRAPLILDVSQLDFLGMTGFRTLLVLNGEHRQARLHWSVVGGARLERLTRVVTDHDLPLADSVPEALQFAEDFVRTRGHCAARQQEPQRETAALRVVD